MFALFSLGAIIEIYIYYNTRVHLWNKSLKSQRIKTSESAQNWLTVKMYTHEITTFTVAYCLIYMKHLMEWEETEFEETKTLKIVG